MAKDTVSHHKIDVSLESGKVKAAPNDAVIEKGTTTTLKWDPSDDLKIRFIGFAEPVGPDKAIDPPKSQSSNAPGIPWIAVDRNPRYEIFDYTIYVEKDGVVYSSDPRIVNEGQGDAGGGW